MALAATSAHAQGKIALDNYSVPPANQVLYGQAGLGGAAGSPVLNNSGWTIGFYYALGDVTANVAGDPSHVADPGTLGGGLAFATGAPGDLTAINAGNGYFVATGDGVINGWTSGSITVEIVAYNGGDYNSSPARGHSSAFTMTPAGTGTPTPAVASVMPGFSVFSVPEPSTFALAGLGAAALLAFRRKKQA